jgi:hypothetical protein
VIDRMLAAARDRVVISEPVRNLPGSDPARAQRIDDLGYFSLADQGTAEDEKAVSHVLVSYPGDAMRVRVAGQGKPHGRPK